MTTISINAYLACDYLAAYRGVRMPYGISAQRPGRQVGVDGDPFVFRREEWESYQWNPPEVSGRAERDPDAAAKPSWDAMVDAHRFAQLRERRDQAEQALRHGTSIDGGGGVDDIRSRLTDAESLKTGFGSIHVGAGLDHMTGLADMARAAAVAGVELPHIVMRDADQKRVSIHLTAELEEILEAVRKRENVVESAHNAVMDRYYEQARIRDDESADLDDREAAAAKARTIAEGYEAELKTEIAAYDPNALPGDLPSLKEAYIERLEAVATGHQKALKGALTQQAIDNWAACVDMDDALQEVAKQCALGILRLRNTLETVWKRNSGGWEKAKPRTGAVTHEGEGDPAAELGATGDTYRDTASGPANLKAVFDTAVEAIQSVSAANTPVITYNISARRVTVRAEHPNVDPAIEGPVVADVGIGATRGDIRTGVTTATVAPAVDTEAAIFRVDFDDEWSGTVWITMRARNLCGPTDFALDLVVAANGGISVAT